MSVSHFVNTWQGRQVAPETVLCNSSSDFETKAPYTSRATYCKMHNIGLQLTLTLEIRLWKLTTSEYQPSKT